MHTQPAVSRFCDSLGGRPYCSDDGTATRIRQKRLALDYSHVSLNRRRIAYLAFDVDRPGAAFAHEAASLPPPTLTMINPDNAHAHLLYELAAPVVSSDLARKKPIQFLADVESRMTVALGADTSFGGLMIKNPLNPAWRTIANDVRYDLGQLLEYLPDRKPRKELEPTGWGRNCQLFDALRQWAYQRASSAQAVGDLDAWIAACIAQSDKINRGFASPLQYQEVRSTGKSVARWTFNNYRPAPTLDRIFSAARTLSQLHGLRGGDVIRCMPGEICKLLDMPKRTFYHALSQIPDATV